MDDFHNQAFDSRSLKLVAAAKHTRPLEMGQQVQLQSGGPVLMVVDMERDKATCAWRDQDGNVAEVTLPAACFAAV